MDTVDGVCDQPAVVPPSAAVALEAGPDSASETAFVSLKLPAAEPREKTMLPTLYALPVTDESVSELVGPCVSTFAAFDADDEPTLPTLSVSCSR